MKCVNCGRKIPRNEIVVYGETAKIFCRTCASTFGTCKMCEHLTLCGFMDESILEPPQFVIAQRQVETPNGIVIEQKQIPNPKRAEQYCTKCNCSRSIEEPKRVFCCRYDGSSTCTNYKEKESFKFG